MTKSVIKYRWIGKWECPCGADGDSANIIYRTMPNGSVSLRCPKCGNRIKLVDDK